jgi:phospho-N-acetylmuramoyl-pentapeptide-transferase
VIAASLILSWFFVGLWMGLMRARGWGKRIRPEGPPEHQLKAGTPSMGGVAFFLAGWLIYLLARHQLGPLWILGLGFALLGLIDDLGGLWNRPLKAREKLAIQVFLALIFGVWAVLHAGLPATPWEVLLIVLAIVGSANAFNFTDGADGLLTTLTLILLLPFQGLATAQSLLGSLLGFLWYNAPPARVFMGDVGSQALGAMTAGIFILEGKIWYLPLAALIPVLEILSVILQVVYFQRTGKRLLRMSPLHHHFELSGWEESKIVFRFGIVTAFTTALALSLWGGRL